MKYFNNVYYISIKDRVDRQNKFNSEISKHNIDLNIEKFNAIQCNKNDIPGWFTAGVGAYGCYQSHLTLLKKAIDNNYKNILIFEDDAVFRAYDNMTWMDSLELCISELPDDWDMFYLGGQHIRLQVGKPTLYSPHLLNSSNANRTHAYAVNNRAFLTLYSHLTDSVNWEKDFHIDHRIGSLHESKSIKVLSAIPWLVGQDEGKSDISGYSNPVYFWDYVPYIGIKAVTDDVILLNGKTNVGEVSIGNTNILDNLECRAWIKAHSNSKCTIHVFKPIKIVGFISNSVNKTMNQRFTINKIVLDTIKDGGSITTSRILQPGDYELRIKSTNTTHNANTYWGLL